MNKVMNSIENALKDIQDGSVIMVGGFMANGTPEKLVDYLCAKDVRNLTLICNDTGLPTKGVGKMVMKKQFKKIIASHVGLNKETGRQMSAGETIVELVPQGTLVERIRCAGYGLGGFLTPTGLGTLVEEGKTKIKVDNKDYLLELPLKADVALLFASKADKSGNLIYKGSMNNFNNIMASAADITVVEVEELVEVGELDPHHIMTPSVFVDYIIDGRNC